MNGKHVLELVGKAVDRNVLSGASEIIRTCGSLSGEFSSLHAALLTALFIKRRQRTMHDMDSALSGVWGAIKILS